MLAALLLAVAAVLCAALGMQYARVFRGCLRARHAARSASLTLWSPSATVLAFNDADLYASWRLARVNTGACLVLLCAAVTLATVTTRYAP